MTGTKTRGSKAVKEARLRLRLTQPEAAKRCKLSLGGYNKIEYGQREPYASTAWDLNRGLGVSVRVWDKRA